jgi:hypothetical protein
MREMLYAASPAEILTHVDRLTTLDEGTPACTQCVKLIAQIVDCGMNTPEDALRIVTGYTEAVRLVVMKVCAACGGRDVVKTHKRSVPLTDLPADDWLRASDALVEAIRALAEVTMFARIEPPPPSSPNGPEPPTHRPCACHSPSSSTSSRWTGRTSTSCARRCLTTTPSMGAATAATVGDADVPAAATTQATMRRRRSLADPSR